MQERKLSIPNKKPFLIEESTGFLLDYLDSETLDGNISNVLIRGLSGCGKSELVNQYAATRQRPLAVLEVGRLSEASQIFGSQTLENGNIIYRPGLFLEAIQTQDAIIHLQELNRSETDKALNAIFSVLDDTFRGVWLDELQRVVKVAPGVVFFATVNEGYQFIGTMPIDDALKNRFSINIELGYLPAENETFIISSRTGILPDVAKSLVETANTLRYAQTDPFHISTRQILAMAKLIKRGAPLLLAFKTVLPKADLEEIEKVLLVLQLKDDGEQSDLLQQTKTWIENSVPRYSLI